MARWMPLPLFSAACGGMLDATKSPTRIKYQFGNFLFKLPLFYGFLTGPKPKKKIVCNDGLFCFFGLGAQQGASSPVSPFNLQPLFSFLGAWSFPDHTWRFTLKNCYGYHRAGHSMAVFPKKSRNFISTNAYHMFAHSLNTFPAPSKGY